MTQTSKTPRAALAVVIILVSGALGFALFRVSRTATPSLTAAQPTTSPAAAAVAETEPAKKKTVPDTLPDITLADKDGKPTKLSSFAGRPLMVNFWATWCAPCRREIPLLNKIRAQRRAQNAEIVGIAVDFREDVLKFLHKTPLDYPLLIGEEDGLAAAEAFGMGMAFPFSVFIDSQNRILTVKVGELHEDEANFAFDRLLDIDKGVMSRDAAQRSIADAFREMSVKRAQAEPASKNSPAN